MAAVTFSRLWLNPVVDPSAGRSFRLASFEVDDDSNAQVEGGYASGRTRLWRRKGRIKVVMVVLRSPTGDDLAWLDDYAGEPLWVREPRGRKLAGAYTKWKYVLTPGPVGDDVSLAITQVTESEAV